MIFLQIGTGIKEWLTGQGFSHGFASGFSDVTDFLIALAFITAIYYILKTVVLALVRKLTRKSSTTWDDALYHSRFFHKVLLLVPGVLLGFAAPFTLDEFPGALNRVLQFTQIYLVFVSLLSVNAFLNAIYEIYQGFEVSKSKPIKGYLQVFKIVLFVFGTIIAISMLLGKSPVYLLGGLGAF